MQTGSWQPSRMFILVLVGAVIGFIVAYLNRPSLLGLVSMPFDNWIQLMPGQIIGHVLVGAVVGGTVGAVLDRSPSPPKEAPKDVPKV